MDGYIYVASRYEKYATSAEYSALTLRDHYPEANITLFTEHHLDRPGFSDVFDNVITKGCPSDSRAKLWALDKTPYDRTLYIDADSSIHHPDIANVFDELGDDDIKLTRTRGYNAAIREFPGGTMTDHCGVFLYNSKPETLAFMNAWRARWVKQKLNRWQWDTTLYPESLRQWDQWSFWWMMNKEDWDIRRGYFKNDARWNFVNGYRDEECPVEDRVIYHHTVDLKDGEVAKQWKA